MKIATVVLATCLVLMGASSCDTLTEEPGTVNVDAPAGKCWSGAMGSSTREGCGSRSVRIEGEAIIVANAQKQDEGRWQLCLQLTVGGDVKDRECTNAAYGIAMVSE